MCRDDIQRHQGSRGLPGHLDYLLQEKKERRGMPPIPYEEHGGVRLQPPHQYQRRNLLGTGDNEVNPGPTFQPRGGHSVCPVSGNRIVHPNETEEIKERELALNATENTRLFNKYLKYVKGATRQPANNFWDLTQKIATYMALLWVLFGDRCNYYRNIYKIHSIMDLPEV